jgi:hypothetical protein
MLAQRPVKASPDGGPSGPSNEALKPAPGQRNDARFGTPSIGGLFPSARSKRVLDPCMLDPKLSMKAADAQLRSAQFHEATLRIACEGLRQIFARWWPGEQMRLALVPASAVSILQAFVEKTGEKTRQPTISVLGFCVNVRMPCVILRQHSTCCAIVARAALL